MIMDLELIFGNNWAPTAIGDNFSTNVLDVGPLGVIPISNTTTDLHSEGMTLEIFVQQTVTSVGAATVEFRLVTDTQTSMASNSTLSSSGVIPKANLVAGTSLRFPLPSGIYKKYVAINANIGTAVLTAGQFQAKFVQNSPNPRIYSSTFSVDA